MSAVRRMGMQRHRGNIIAVGPQSRLRCPTEGCAVQITLSELYHSGRHSYSPIHGGWVEIHCAMCRRAWPVGEWLRPRWPDALEGALELAMQRIDGIQPWQALASLTP